MSRPTGSGPRHTPSAASPASRFAVAALVVAGALALAGCGDGGGGDEATFCAAIEALRADAPFAELAVATPAEMRDAFDALTTGAGRIAAAASGDVAVPADRYRDAVDAVRDELAGAGYDPTRVDNRRYARAVEEYSAAADSLDNAADARC